MGRERLRQVPECVAVNLPPGTVAGVEGAGDASRVNGPKALGKPGVENPGKPVHRNGKSLREIGVGDLSPGRDPGVGASGSGDSRGDPAKGGESFPQDPLNGSPVRLNLPSGKVSSVVG